MVNNDLIFCSGNMDISYTIMNQYINSPFLSIDLLQELAIKYHNDNSLLEIVVGKFINNKIIVYQISSYNNFEIIEKSINSNNIGLWSAGIKTADCFDFAYEELKNKKSIQNIYQNTFDKISFEGIGGQLNVYKLYKNNCGLLYQNNIKETNINRINIGKMHNVVAERLYGQIIAGVNLTITTQNGDFLVNDTGVNISGLALTITDGGLTESHLASSVVTSWQGYADTILGDFISNTYDIDIANIQDQIDGNITTWFYDYEPTLLNVPASSWTTDVDKNDHLGDLFYNTETGYGYRFAYVDSTYQWIRITDTDLISVLEIANNAQDTADSKRRIFVEQPIPPYDVGDLWTEGASGDLKVCIVAKIAGQLYLATDWNYASKYYNSVIKGENINGVTIDVTNGLKIVRGDTKVQSIFNATEGILIQRNDGTVETPSWADIFSVDTNGVLTAEDLIANKLIMKNGGDILINGDTKTIDFSKFLTIAGTINADNINLKGINVYNALNELTFGISTGGDLTINGNVTMTGGSISWVSVTPPTASDVGAIPLTYIDGNGVYTGKVACNQLSALGNNPIIKLFQDLVVDNGGDPALDATLNAGEGIGDRIRLKWNDDTYFAVTNNQFGFYFYNSGTSGTTALAEIKSDGYYWDSNRQPTIFVQSGTPATAITNDLWIQI